MTTTVQQLQQEGRMAWLRELEQLLQGFTPEEQDQIRADMDKPLPEVQLGRFLRPESNFARTPRTFVMPHVGQTQLYCVADSEGGVHAEGLKKQEAELRLMELQNEFGSSETFRIRLENRHGLTQQQTSGLTSSSSAPPPVRQDPSKAWVDKLHKLAIGDPNMRGKQATEILITDFPSLTVKKVSDKLWNIKKKLRS